MISFNKDKIAKAIGIILIFTVFLWLFGWILLNFIGFENYFDSDMYAEQMVARLISEQKKLFPDNYVYSNQYHVISTPVIAALLNCFLKDINLSTKLATLFVTFVILSAFVWAIKPFAKRNSIIFGILILLSSAIGPQLAKQYEGQLFFVGLSYYSSYLVTLLFALGCYGRIDSEKDISKFAIILSLLLSFACGMQSLRETVVMALPFLCCCVFYHNKKSVIYVLKVFIANILGTIVIKFLPVSNHTLYGTATFSSPSIWLDNILEVLDSFKKITGIRWLFKGNPVGLYGIILVIMIVSSLFLSYKKKNRDSELTKYTTVLLFSLLGVSSSCVIMNIQIRYIYLFTYYALAALSGVVFLKRTIIFYLTFTFL